MMKPRNQNSGRGYPHPEPRSQNRGFRSTVTAGAEKPELWPREPQSQNCEVRTARPEPEFRSTNSEPRIRTSPQDSQSQNGRFRTVNSELLSQNREFKAMNSEP